ncbi:hypothetical protein sscle_15g106070 [Sclerotinia sclerotiorum 1980 UF-70]|uniref:Uncharacterized protein n=1 Tax=Sclerotinia sclerotiorum (strain ATCC 18683 / 1980 / Ss-1) TaxID=665079 RepID=A0A1D9QLM4_SCLS1|nr:hypothetical protein sscle_15g106070 [Sclerotinia sclerotiorum 1980 UF-70]
MCKKHHITFTAILTGMFHLTLAGTCTIAYIINHKDPLPLSIQILENNCENGIGGKKHLPINATPDDIETDPMQTSPTTKFTVEYIADDKPARIKADGKEMFWRSADKGDRMIWTAPFDCHLRRGKSNP